MELIKGATNDMPAGTEMTEETTQGFTVTGYYRDGSARSGSAVSYDHALSIAKTMMEAEEFNSVDIHRTRTTTIRVSRRNAA